MVLRAMLKFRILWIACRIQHTCIAVLPDVRYTHSVGQPPTFCGTVSYVSLYGRIYCLRKPRALRGHYIHDTLPSPILAVEFL